MGKDFSMSWTLTVWLNSIEYSGKHHHGSNNLGENLVSLVGVERPRFDRSLYVSELNLVSNIVL